MHLNKRVEPDMTGHEMHGLFLPARPHQRQRRIRTLAGNATRSTGNPPPDGVEIVPSLSFAADNERGN